MDPVVFQRLTRERGWSPEQYEHWFTDSIPRLLLPVMPLSNATQAEVSP
jgi:hypothetical protein